MWIQNSCFVFRGKSQYEFSYENNDFVIWAACGLEFGVEIKTEKPTPLPGAGFRLNFLNLGYTSLFFRSQIGF